jgi:transcriptional regulator with XRE-family HTH domain
MDLRDVFAFNLRRVRHQRGLSLDDLAYEADVIRSYLSQIEKGSFQISLKVIGKLAEALRVEPAEFLKISDCAGQPEDVRQSDPARAKIGARKASERPKGQR